MGRAGGGEVKDESCCCSGAAVGTDTTGGTGTGTGGSVRVPGALFIMSNHCDTSFPVMSFGHKASCSTSTVAKSILLPQSLICGGGNDVAGV